MPLRIPEAVIERLPSYYRQVRELRDAGVRTVSSQEIGDALDVPAAQIRKDLSYFGRFGKQGHGYAVERLADELEAILGFNRHWRMVLVGAGGLGRTIASVNQGSFQPKWVRYHTVYEMDAWRVGTDVGGLTVQDLRTVEDDLRDDSIEIGIVAVSSRIAQEVTDALVRAGLRSILNYTSVVVQTPPDVEVRHVHPVLALQTLTYRLTNEVEVEPGT